MYFVQIYSKNITCDNIKSQKKIRAATSLKKMKFQKNFGGGEIDHPQPF